MSTKSDPDWSALLGTIRLLGYGGLIPFAALALAAWGGTLPIDKSLCLTLLRAYGLAIVSFIGAISWGIALVSGSLDIQKRKRLLLWSVTPSLIGFASFGMTAPVGCLVLAATAALALLVDIRNTPSIGLPQSWRALRIHLSLGAIAALLSGAISAGLHG